MIKLLVVDDSALMRRLLGKVFGAQGDFQVEFARNGLEALAMLDSVRPDVITLDVHMPEMDGLACLDRIMLERPCPVVMISSLTEAGADVTLEAMQLGAVDFIAKPQGAMSLEIDDLAPLLVEKVRAAARARPRGSLRLAERVRLKISAPGLTPLSLPRPRQARTKLAGNGVVLVGTSTGGPPALDAVLGPLPADFPWPIIVAQHMPAAFTGPLARRLDRLCALEVVEVVRPIPLQAGKVFIGRGDADIIIGGRTGGPVVLAAPAAPEHRWHPSVDRLVVSAMDHFEAARLLGVLMTGMGNDGATTMTRLRAQGGRTIAEAEETAIVWGMPGELVRAGGADAVVPLEGIAGQLMEWLG
ncbi:chemotaxis-specific protein-glutamate methyltransferase CheB [Roseomonas aerophila]|uniref:Protein-glutamate methylesterase/protein-glutamine glutaminase n=1 Tax=Teichococcus aerophilus TaxID=1224513 RepID=A0ABR7RN48_9PROT|nr:chemotaxis-specific protein-glutamate methyltransferase CheB [Pseudoroseomonas aerophila]